MTKQNPATVWATTLVEELARNGLAHVCIAPGSRSTALTLAFAAHPALRVWRHLDERSAGFFALGMALALEQPVALVCTSGTAAANFFPAIVEAKMSEVPLLVLTADRPPELRQSGANQTIDQIKLYGDQVLWSVDVALPEADPAPVALRNLRTLAARALATANGLRKGPVHLNLPFRKPFEPAETATDRQMSARSGDRAWTQIEHGRLLPTEAQLEHLRKLIEEHERGLIVCGPRCPGDPFPQAVAALAAQAGYPIMADPLSGVRYGPWVDGPAVVCGGYETYLAGAEPGWPAPELVIRFGAVPTSKWLNNYLAEAAPAHLVHVRAGGVWADDSHLLSLFLQVDETSLCRSLAHSLSLRENSGWLLQVARIEDSFWEQLQAALALCPPEQFFDGAAVATIAAALPEGAHLVVGNSLPVRHLDQFVRPTARRLYTYGNRGASGIDGNVSLALGVAAAHPGEPVVFVVGDVTFYHDLNGLLAAHQYDLDLTIVLLNNNGGGIFRRLPVARLASEANQQAFADLFLTPHALDFEPAAALYNLDYKKTAGAVALWDSLQQSLARPGCHLLEVQTDGARDEARRHQLTRQVMADIERQPDKP